MCMDEKGKLRVLLTLPVACAQVITGILYMFGGWDGSSDLSDLWQFTVQTSLWECLSTDASQEVKWCNCSLLLYLSCLVFVGRSQWPLLS